uniref:Mon2_C domain-containing protein n=1 Tax=Echinostoma caproni TaxID=27848 RepID=A0A183B8N8_9TREM
LSSLVPALLALLEADKRNWHIYTATSNTESDHDDICSPPDAQSRTSPSATSSVSNTPPAPRCSVDLSVPGMKHAFTTRKQISEASSSLDEDTFYSTVSPLLNALVQFLGGHRVSFRTQPISDQCGILSQITELIMTTVEPELTDFEQITRCMADCLVLRSLCHVLSSVFHNRYKLSTAAVTDPSQFSANTDICSQFTEFAKQYDSAIRLLSEHLVDLSAMYCNNLIVDVHLPDQTGCANNWSGLECNRNVRTLDAFLHRLWHCLGQSCPAGLSRQLLAHIGAQCLGSFVQLFATEEYAVGTDPIVARNDAWITLRTAEFCLFASSEHVTDVVGLNQRSLDISLIHSTAALLAQLLLCRHMPDACWSKYVIPIWRPNCLYPARPGL